ncbi:MAG: peroxiredoxin [Acidobacteria bacterium RIFCSPLOWO2_12_FULL_67_14b]|nr:MAG: peroxiredoxin [Acidobacteria bacterium RIFCSPLOWO2_12_FULL_67_14b]
MARQAEAEWKGDLKGGGGRVKLGSGAYEGNYSFATRFENGTGANPEELLGAAHAGCYSMALANSLATAGFTPTSVRTTAAVHLGKDDKGFLINLIELTVDAVVPKIDNATFQQHAEKTRVGCIIARALASVPTTVKATLK